MFLSRDMSLSGRYMLVFCVYFCQNVTHMYGNLNAFFISAMHCYIIITNLYLLNIKKKYISNVKFLLFHGTIWCMENKKT